MNDNKIASEINDEKSLGKMGNSILDDMVDFINVNKKVDKSFSA